MSSAGTVEVARCTSCDAEYAGSYCHSCGEPRPHEGDLALRHLLHEGVHELSHLDGKIWRTIRALLFEPGRLTKAYWEGRRGQWVRPFRLYLTIYVLHLLLLPNVAGPLAFRFAAYRDPAYIFLMLRRIFEQNNWITALKTIPVLLLFVVIELGTAVAIVAASPGPMGTGVTSGHEQQYANACHVPAGAMSTVGWTGRNLMNRLIALAIVLAAVVAVRADGVPTVVTYVPHDQVTSVMAKGGQIIGDHGLIVLAQRRGAGEVEVHAKTNHVFIIVEGEATFVTGGTLVNARQTAPDQTRAASVDGGETHHLAKGDVITIPAKTPHWFKDVPTQTIAYYAINTEP